MISREYFGAGIYIYTHMISIPTEIEPCTSDLCQNGGSCDDSSGSFVCTCTQLFTGRFCETGDSRTPCNIITIINIIAFTLLSRLSYYIYLLYIFIDFDGCYDNPCLNGGVCIPDKLDYYCNCGHRCECANVAVQPNCALGAF